MKSKKFSTKPIQKVKSELKSHNEIAKVKTNHYLIIICNRKFKKNSKRSF